MNRERFLREAAEAHVEDILTNGHGVQFSLASKPVARISPEDVRGRILPAVMEKLGSSDPEERALAALALGQARVPGAFGPLRKMLSDGRPSDRRAAALALGFLDEPLAVPVLIDFVKRAGISPAERAYGALALGFLGSPDAAPALRKYLKDSLGHSGRAMEEFQSAAVTGLGLLKDRKSIRILIKIVENGVNRSEKVRSSAVLALARIGDKAATPTLIRALSSNQVHVRRSAAQALGVMGSPQAKPVLIKSFQEDGDIAVRNFAAISLARLGGKEVGQILEDGLAVKNPRALRGFSAIALGILGDKSRGKALRAVLERPDEVSMAGAAAIGLGLLKDNLALPTLRKIAFDESRDSDLRGYSVMALALQHDRTMKTKIRDLARRTGSEQLRRSATLAMGLYGDLPAAPTVLSSLFEEGDVWVKGAAVSSLAIQPRRTVLDPILGILESKGFSKTAKKDALLALGVMAREGRPSPAERLLSDANYHSLSAAAEAVAALF